MNMSVCCMFIHLSAFLFICLHIACLLLYIYLFICLHACLLCVLGSTLFDSLFLSFSCLPLPFLALAVPHSASRKTLPVALLLAIRPRLPRPPFAGLSSPSSTSCFLAQIALALPSPLRPPRPPSPRPFRPGCPPPTLPRSWMSPVSCSQSLSGWAARMRSAVWKACTMLGTETSGSLSSTSAFSFCSASRMVASNLSNFPQCSCCGAWRVSWQMAVSQIVVNGKCN